MASGVTTHENMQHCYTVQFSYKVVLFLILTTEVEVYKQWCKHIFKLNTQLTLISFINTVWI
jgi:hypothetical protein